MMKYYTSLIVCLLAVTACGGSSRSSTPPNSGGIPPSTTNCSNPTQVSALWAFEQNVDAEYSALLAMDGLLTSDSRWESEGDERWIIFDLGAAHDVQEIRTAWHLADERTTVYDIQSSLDGDTWFNVALSLQSQGTEALMTETVTNTDARYIRLVGHGNSINTTNALLEAQIYSCGTTGSGTSIYTPVATPGTPLPVISLNPSLPPSGNFDLTTWYVSIPTDYDNNGRADSIYESTLNSGYQSMDYFYTADDGGMVFRCPVDGYKTSTNTSYTRVELREMMRAGNTSISTQGVNGNNWVFASAPETDKNNAGGIDGTLKATLAVNHVTTTGVDYQIGRVIIGQIHANDDEPVRLYYRKLPDNDLGSIYIAHEPIDEDDLYFEMIGSRDNSADNPSDGIALNEVFSYEIHVEGNTLSVSILRNGKATVTQSVSMYNSGYDQGGQYMYFKAGAYNQNNSGDPDDYVQTTFYRLETTHR